MDKLNRWYRNLAFRKRVLLSHLTVSLIPVIILGAFCYFQTRNLLINREKEALSGTLNQSVVTLDSTLKTYVHVMENITWDTKIQQALARQYESNLDMYLTYRDVITPTIARMKSLNPQIKQISLYSSNSTLYPHGNILMPVERMEDFSGGPSDYNIHWLADEKAGIIKMYCRIYPDFNFNRNVVYIELDYDSVFGYMTHLFDGSYGILIIDEEQNPVFSYSAFKTGETAYDGLDISDLTEGSQEADKYVIDRNEIGSNGWKIYLYRPLEEISSSAGSITALIVLTVILCLAVILLASLLLSKSVVRPLAELIRNIDRIEEGNMTVDAQAESGDEFGLLINRFGKMMERLNHLVNEVYKSKILQQQYEMKALQAQINPHFLYNSLSLINWKAIMAGQEDISKMTQLLSTFYRTTLNKGTNVIDIKGEWDNTSSYVHIQRMMHSGKFEAILKLEEGMEEYQMLNLLLQPLVENAIVHGLDHKTVPGDRVLKVTGRQEEGELIFTVEDNGCGIPEDVLEGIFTAGTKGYGVQNVHHRIQLYYGQSYGLTFESRVGEGTRVTLKIPKVEKEQEQFLQDAGHEN
ncbi:MAG: sensor histidine kinase [Lacrimispora sp.]|uniref:sensor histidine kinase n=1 Tax=Lacrimispora sp. TaxID=2719234 RepID=UPI0039E2487A